MAQVCWRCAALRAEGDCESARRAEGIKRPVPNLPWAPGAGSGRMVQAVGQSMWAECSLLLCTVGARRFWAPIVSPLRATLMGGAAQLCMPGMEPCTHPLLCCHFGRGLLG